MGKIPQGIFGGVKGRIGNLIGSSWKGINVLKSAPLSVANPRTAPQVAQRSNMTAIVILAQLTLSQYIKPMWDRFAVKMSGFNDFVATNIGCFVAGTFIDHSNFIISKGKMASTLPSSLIALDADHGCTVSWIDDSGSGYKLATDEALFIGYNDTKDEWGTQLDVCYRNESPVVISFPSALSTGDTLHIYTAFRRADGTIVSNTGYTQKTVTAG